MMNKTSNEKRGVPYNFAKSITHLFAFDPIIKRDCSLSLAGSHLGPSRFTSLVKPDGPIPPAFRPRFYKTTAK